MKNLLKRFSREYPFVLLLTLTSARSENPPNPLSRWTWRNPDPQGEPLYGVTYANGRFVAVGGSNTIIISTNGSDWHVVRTDKFGDFYGITFGNGRYVVVGSGENLISDDGENWEPRPSGTSNTLFSVTYGNGTFVAVGGRLSIVTSTNGLDWVLQQPNSQAGDNFYGVTFGNGMFLASGSGAGIATSTDAQNWAWQPQYCNGPGTAYFSEGQFFYTGLYPGGTMTSSDGTNWVRTQAATGFTFSGIVRGSNILVGVADYWPSSIQVSSNSVDWIALTNAPSDRLEGVAFGNGRFVAVGVNGAIYKSEDGINWTSQLKSLGFFFGGTYTDKGFLLVGDPPGSVCRSKDGMQWDSVNLNVRLYSVAAGQNMYVAAGAGGTIYTSRDTVTWSPAVSPTTTDIRGLAYGNGLFLGIAGTAVLRSTNGFDWGVSYGACCAHSIAWRSGEEFF